MSGKILALLVLLLIPVLSAQADYEETRRTIVGDETIAVDGKLIIPDSVNLSGHKLKYTGVTTIIWGTDATFTSSSASCTGELWIEHTDNVIQTTAFSGNLKFIKDGAGTWTLPASSTYSGGTEVRDGRLNVNTTLKKISSSFKPYGTGPTIDIYGGAVEGKAFTDWKNNYVLNLHGGTFENTAQADNGTAFNVPINVYEDSSYKVGHAKIYSLAGDVDLNGKTLHILLTNTLRYNPTSVTDGTISVTGKDNCFQLERDVNTPSVNLAMDAILALNGKTFDIGDFALTSDGTVFGEGALRVHGVYKPTALDVYYPRMVDGSTLDLSGLNGAPCLTTDCLGAGCITLVLDGASLTNENKHIIRWNGLPGSTTFRYCDKDGTEIDGHRLTVASDGIICDVNEEKIVTTIWTGAAGDGDYLNPANWRFLNILGDVVEVTEITQELQATLTPTFMGDVSEIRLDSSFPFTKICFVAAYLSHATDWSTFDINKMSPDSILDLKGQRLALPVLSGVSTTAATIANSGPQVSLDLVVNDGNVYTNACLKFVGKIDVVKKGAGILVAAKSPQEYDGMTIVSNGVLQCVAGSDMDSPAKASPFGSSRTVKVESHGILDPAGSHSWEYHTIILAGGIISNTVAEIGANRAQYNTGSFPRPFNPMLHLLQDAHLVSLPAFNFAGEIRASHRKLTIITENDFYWAAVKSDAAWVEFTGGKVVILQNFPTFPAATGALSLIMNGASFDFGGGLCVSNYQAKTTGDAVRTKDDWHENAKNLGLFVAGTFTPFVDRFFGCTMMDGSTICLKNKTDVWSTKSRSHYNNGRLNVGFAPGARITIDVGGRKFKDRTQIVAWDEGSTNGIGSVKFRIDAQSKSAGYRLLYERYVDTNRKGGLYVIRQGFVLIIR